MWLDPLSYRLFKGAGFIPAGQGRGPIVLMYHSIEPYGRKPESRWAVSAENFAAQMDLLRENGWTTFLFRDLLRAAELPPKSVVITFDDGYADNYKNGFKALQKRGMCATWFIATGCVGGRASWEGENGRPMLNWKQILEMYAAGMELGAHTRTHLALPDLEPSSVWSEIGGSKVDLEQVVDYPVESFAYPYGRYDHVSMAAVKKAGFTIACTTETGWFGSQRDLFKVRRIPVFSYDTLSSFARKIAFADPDVRFAKTAGYLWDRIKDRIKRAG